MVDAKSIYFNCDIVHCALENGADLCVNEDQYVSEYRVSLAERKKERRRKVDFGQCLRPANYHALGVDVHA